MGYYFTKHQPLHHHREIHATYVYITNAQLKIDHKIMHEWDNSVLTPIHTLAITSNRTVVKDCANSIRTYGHTNTTAVT